jgi:hypothetical protein
MVEASVPLAMLEALKAFDHPGEVMKEENLTMTLPRRLGLSDVIDRQIRLLRVESRRGRRVPMTEVLDLIRLVLRRPDADRVFEEVGRSLAVGLERPGTFTRFLPRTFALRRAHQRSARLVNRLMGARILTVELAEISIRFTPRDISGLSEDGERAVAGLLTGVLDCAARGAAPHHVSVRQTSGEFHGARHRAWILELHEGFAVQGTGAPTPN